MRKLREVMRLRFELHLGYEQIGRSCAIGVSTVCKYLKRAEAAGLTWPLPEGFDDARVEAALFPRSGPPAIEQTPARSKPDFVSIHEQLRQHRHLTLQLLWEEYRQANPDAHWAETIGPNTARLFERIMADKPHPEMGYRGCLGIIRLAEKYSAHPLGSRCRTSAAHRRLSLQKHRVHLEELARPGTAVRTATVFHPTT